jgi:hypothetical protein
MILSDGRTKDKRVLVGVMGFRTMVVLYFGEQNVHRKTFCVAQQ